MVSKNSYLSSSSPQNFKVPPSSHHEMTATLTYKVPQTEPCNVTEKASTKRLCVQVMILLKTFPL